MKQFKKLNQRGFSLVELLVVIAIIAVLSVVAYTSFSGSTDKAADSKNLSNIDAIANAVEIYKVNEGFYPSALVTGEVDPDKHIPKNYLSSIPKDPSGHEYLYKAANGTFQVAAVLRKGGDPASFETYVVGNGDNLLTSDTASYYDTVEGKLQACDPGVAITQGKIATNKEGTEGEGEGPFSCIPYDPTTKL